MPKKCIICDKEAEFRIKDSNEFYCRDCAEENFNDLSLLQKVEEEAQALNKFISEKVDGNLQNNQDRED